MGYLVSHAYCVGGRMYRDMAHYGFVVTNCLLGADGQINVVKVVVRL